MDVGQSERAVLGMAQRTAHFRASSGSPALEAPGVHGGGKNPAHRVALVNRARDFFEFFLFAGSPLPAGFCARDRDAGDNALALSGLTAG